MGRHWNAINEGPSRVYASVLRDRREKLWTILEKKRVATIVCYLESDSNVASIAADECAVSQLLWNEQKASISTVTGFLGHSSRNLFDWSLSDPLQS
jgi:hypothetical protein